ncbi:GIY-YIG nuclease family protein [Nostoc sp. CHAB 5834]|nr:GIY-YIG nuclease family protein [Nostoc sp. CHAB 5834]
MNISLRPGYVYVGHSKARPADVKIGYSLLPKKRVKALGLADPDFVLHGHLFFLDAVAAERRVHAAFADRRVARETFLSSRKRAMRELQREFDNEQALRLDHAKAVRLMMDLGELSLESSSQVLECNGSALSRLKSFVPNARDGRNVLALISQALSQGSLAADATKLLSKFGLLPYPMDGVVLIDKSKTSPLDRVFKGADCGDTWRQQLIRHAGFDCRGYLVGIDAWSENTRASGELIDKVIPPDYNEGCKTL